WDFGDGATSTLQNPVHIYQLGGDYNVVLFVTDTSGCSNSISHLVTIHSSPQVYFDFSTPCCENNEIEFIDLSSTSSGYICEWIWDFGDGTGDTINYPNSGNTTHIYSQAGNYLVMLTVTTTDSCFNSDSQTILISSSPIADYDYEGQCYNEPVQFHDQSIPVGGINIYQWYWDFGDPLSGANNYSYDPNPTHLFTQPGSYEVLLQVTNVGECTDTITQTVDVSEIPDVEFTYSDTNCLGNTTYFYIDTAIVNTSIIAQYIWDFGDGTNYSYQQNPTHIYEFTGDYNVTLTVTDLNGCSNSISHIVTVNPLPFAVFSYSPACENDTTFFTDHSYTINGEPIVSWYWDFGDPGSGLDNYSTLQDPYHIYTQMATYDVKLIVNSESGCMDSIIMQLVINPLPTANFIYQADACENGLVYFTDLSSGWQTVITDWLWEFEPGYYSTSMNPVYNFYNTDTTYIVSLTVTDGHGCENTKTDSVYIPAGLVFDIEYTAACFGDPTHFNATILQPVGDSLISFFWDFGEPESGHLNYSNESNPSHTYLEPGYYTVSLGAMDINGCVDTVYRQIVVNELPEPDFTYETFICDNNIYFTDISNANGASINYWEWNFGDGQDTTYNVFAPVITHNYQNPGFYNVELLVTNNNDCSNTIIKEVYREECLKSVFNVLDTLCCQRFNISFSDSSFHKDIITEWKWDFGDGQDTIYNVFAPVITHTYQEQGLYNVELIVVGIFNDNVLSDTSYKEIEIYATPYPDFIAEPVCLNNITNFFDMSQPNGISIVSWNWDFGDNVPGDTSSVRNPVYFYSYADTFDVRLLVTNEMGCFDSIILPAVVHSLPYADFDYSPACLGDPTQFTDLSTNDFGDVTIWNWNFGDTLTTQDTSTLQNPIYVYNYTGGFTVSLIIENQNGCLDTISKDIIVNIIPTSDFILIDNYNNFQGYVKLVNKSTGAISYLWLFGDGNESIEENPIYTFEEDGDYEIQLISFNEFDCTDTLIYDYSLLFKGLFVPNAFSPTDLDAEVRIFKPKGINLLTYHIQIFNSWGNIIWESTKIDENGSPAEGWDGTYKGELLPLDVYVWKISASFTDGTIWEGVSVGNTDGLSKKTFGTVTLLR
ncbi:MAG: PKD domain-containing protein, partial [Bacteroidales bacterium]|nr:PKD domain-containing protein [Bacteroidales bacterium]